MYSDTIPLYIPKYFLSITTKYSAIYPIITPLILTRKETTEMPRISSTKQKINLSLPSRLKRRVQDLAKDKGLTMNDLLIHAIEEYLNKSDGTYQNADLVVDRLTQVLNSQMAVINQLNQLTMKLND